MNLVTTRWRAVAGAFALTLLLTTGASAQRTVTLRLNTATLPDTTKPNAAIQVRGCLEGCVNNQSALPGGGVIAWNDATTLRPTNQGGDYWRVQFQIPDNQKLSFKFYSDQAENVAKIGGWEDGGDVVIAAGTGNVDLGLHYFNKTGGDQAYNRRAFAAKGDSVGVYFRVYMSTVDGQNKGYNPAAPAVGIRGDALAGSAGPLDWGSTKITLRRESTAADKPGYHTYAGVAYYARPLAGQTQNYKFITGANGFENDINGGNRSFKVPGQDTTLAWVLFGNTKAVQLAQLKTANVSFTADMTPLEQIGIFNRARGDSIEVRGAFNGWNCGTPTADPGSPDDCLMTRITGTTQYELQVPFRNTAVGSQQNYKFYIEFRDDAFIAQYGRRPPSGWEENINSTGTNRAFEFTGTDPQELRTEFFNGIVSANVIPGGTTVNTTFRVDMRPAISSTAQPFVPTRDSVFVRFGDPIWVFTQGLPLNNDGNPIRYRQYRLTDGDGDAIYEGTFPVRGPTYSGIGYIYEYGAQGTGFVEDQTTIGTEAGTYGRRRTRFIVPTGSGWPTSYALTTSPEVFQAVKAVLPYECNPGATGATAYLRPPGCLASGKATVTGVEEVEGDLPSSVVLGGAYPNPTTGRMRFVYGLPAAQHVSLKVYDVMGREVATVVDAMQAAANYEASFDGSGLAAGVYVYRLTAGGRSVSRTVVVQ